MSSLMQLALQQHFAANDNRNRYGVSYAFAHGLQSLEHLVHAVSFWIVRSSTVSFSDSQPRLHHEVGSPS